MRNIYIAILMALALAAQAVWMAGNTLAATRLTEDLADLFRSAQLVVEADILDCAVAPAGREGVLLTRATLKIVRVIKGECVAGSQITAECLGGHDGERTTVVPGQANLLAGARAVLLLSKFKGCEHWRVVAGDAGQIEIDGSAARRTCGAPFCFYAKDAASLTGFSARRPTELDRATLDTLLRALATSGRPEIESPGGVAMQVSAPAPRSAPRAAAGSVRVPDAAQAWSLGMGGRIVAVMLALLGWVVGSRLLARLRKAGK